MSDLQRSFARAKLEGLPFIPPESFDEAEEEGEEEEEKEEEEEEETDGFAELPVDNPEDDSSSASSASSAGTVKPTANKKLFARPTGTPNKKTLDPIPWTIYFERELNLQVTHDPATTITHHAYLTSPTGNGPLFVTHHGAGSSGLSFAVLATEIRKLLPGAGILSLDARGHGSTKVTHRHVVGNHLGADPNAANAQQHDDEPPMDLSLPTLSADLVTVVNLTREAMAWPPATMPPLVLIGHSLGGAVVTDVARAGKLGDAVLGYAVLDVVEGSAMDALQSMHNYLSMRPLGFATLQAGIEWHIRSRTVRNAVSARTSVPALLSFDGGGGRLPWIWKTDLAATQPFWEGWFVGLSKKFLEAKGGKLLLLAGTDRLDKELIIGQMQGKYALHVFPEAGHFIHEDLPEKTAVVIVEFYRRNDRSALVLPPKVLDMLKAGRKI